MSKIFDWLYLGSKWDAMNEEWLINEGISNILNVAFETYNIQYTNNFNVMKIPILDHPNENIERELDVGYSYIALVKSNNQKILVHCVAGISRSTTFVLYYLMKDNHMSLSEAINFIREKRPHVKPNNGFMTCLYNNENKNKDIIPADVGKWICNVI